MEKEEVSAEATLTEQYRVAIPREIREAAHLEPGTKLHITVQSDGTLRLETWEQQAERVRAAIAAALVGDGSPADELVAERHEEARLEEAS